MRAPFGLCDDHLAADELDRLVLAEDAQLDEPVVLLACPVPVGGLRRHWPDPKVAPMSGQCPRSDTPSRYASALPLGELSASPATATMTAPTSRRCRHAAQENAAR